jgi:hypothetical protein
MPSKTSQKKQQKKQGRPAKGHVKVLVSLEREEAAALTKAARVRGLLEDKRGDVSELIREIIAESDYWIQLRYDLTKTLKAINASELARSLRDQVYRMHPRRDRAAAGAALRAGLAGLMKEYETAYRLAEPAMRAATTDLERMKVEDSYRHLRPALGEHLHRRGILSVGYDGTFVPVDKAKRDRERKDRDPKTMSDEEIAEGFRKRSRELLAEPVGVPLDAESKP